MQPEARKRSPRAPSISLEEAIDRTSKVYAVEGKHPAPYDVIAKHIGYSKASSGAAATALASMRYYGLLERPKEGFLAVSRDFESYKFAPGESVGRDLLIKWLRSPPLFADLLSIYTDSLPSDGTIKYELLKRGFNPGTADECVKAFRESVTLARFYERTAEGPAPAPSDDPSNIPIDESDGVSGPRLPMHRSPPGSTDTDQIPIRLTGGRRAYIVVPTPFFESDKKRLIAQIELLLTDAEEDKEQGA